MGFKITVINLLAIDRHGKTELESVKKKKLKLKRVKKLVNLGL